MLLFRNLAVLALAAVTFAQDYYDEEPRPRPAPARVQPGYSGPAEARPTPIAILKQINRHNEDGSYTYGYEAGDGTFKIETKLPTGEVKGKYGYVDDVGKVRVVEYGATKYGFEPSGEGITVPPPTLVDESAKGGQQDQDYYEPPQQAPVRKAPALRPRPQPQQSYESYSPPQQFEPAPAPVPARAQITGAVPVPPQQNFDFGPPSRPAPARSFAPAPPRPRPAPVQFAQPINDGYDAPRTSYAQPAPQPARPAPQFAPAPRPAQSYAPRPNPSVPTAGRGGILDQLSKITLFLLVVLPLYMISVLGTIERCRLCFVERVEFGF
ncbi:hypothetical protein JTB14_017466 [Gonioctena quinquepunctata]|nr:hypothetical protein JTB14_017466 [Gonioctena quinquepunctata]